MQPATNSATSKQQPERTPRPRRPAAPALRAGLILLALAVLLLLPALLPGRVLSPADLIFETPAFSDSAPDRYDGPSNSLLFDQVYQFTPWRAYARDRLRDGDLPLWNPHSSTGTPFIATMQSAVFYPVNLVLLPFSLERSLVLSALIRLWVAGFTTYLLARRYGLGQVPALLSGAAFMFSAFLVVWLGHPHTNAAVWLPATILAVEMLLRASDRASLLRWSGVLAIVTGIQLTGGHVETSLDIVFAAALYFGLRAWSFRAPVRHTLQRLGPTAASGLLGVGIAAVQLLPFVEWLPLSAEYQRRSATSFDLLNPVFLKNLLGLPLALFPDLYNNPTWDNPYWSFNPWGSYNESALYAGTIPLALAIVAAVVGWRSRSEVRVWTVLGLLALGMALQLPVLDWVNQLPVLSLAHPGRLRLVTLLAVAMLAGFGLQAILAESRQSDWALTWTRRLLYLPAAICAALLAGGALLQASSDPARRFLEWLIFRYQDDAAPPRTVSICADQINACATDIVDALSPANVEMFVPGFVALAGIVALTLAGRVRGGRQRVAVALVLLSAVDLYLFASGYNPVVSDDAFYPEPPAIAALQDLQTTDRMTVLQQDMLPDAHMIYGLSDVRGLDFPTARYNDYLDATGDRTPWLANGVLLGTLDSDLLTALNIRYVLTSNPHIVDGNERLRVIEEIDGIYLTEIEDARPRAYMVYDAVIAPDDTAALNLLHEQPELVTDRAVLADAEGARRAVTTLPGESGSNAVELLEMEPERVAWQVQTGEPGLLVVSDAYYPDWDVTVDGQEAELLRANVAFRAVAVPEGDHRVEFRYEPQSVRYGLVISLVSRAVALGMIAASFMPGAGRRGGRVAGDPGSH